MHSQQRQIHVKYKKMHTMKSAAGSSLVTRQLISRSSRLGTTNQRYTTLMEGRLSRTESERIIAILEDTTEKLGFLDR
jgi:hypothetical protein